MKFCLLVLLCFAQFSSLWGQIPLHIITLSGDSILYNNAPFNFHNFIDGRIDTTKLGLLKETQDASSFQQLALPTDPSAYLKSFINNVVTHTDAAEKVVVVIKTLSLVEEPMGAIEIAKVKIDFEFYLELNQQYKLIKGVQIQQDFPDKNVTPVLGAQLEKAVRAAFYNFLTQPSTEGESDQWLSKTDFRNAIIPAKRLSTGPIGELTYNQNKFLLNGASISKKEALKLLLATNDPEIEQLIKKHKSNGALSYILGISAATFIGYPVGRYIGTEDELNGMMIMYGSLGIIGSLLSAKSNRHHMHQAIDLFNKRYNN